VRTYPHQLSQAIRWFTCSWECEHLKFSLKIDIFRFFPIFA